MDSISRIRQYLGESSDGGEGLLVVVRWDDSDKSNAGWYAEVMKGGRTITDSEKTGFPVDLEDYDESEGKKVLAALKKAYPKAEIKMK